MTQTANILPTSRRDFFRQATLAAKSITVAALGTSTARAAGSSDSEDELIYMSATKLAGLIRAKKVSATEAVEAYIARQIEVNDKLNAVVMNCFSRARAEAKAADAAAARGKWMGPLHGVPITIKDSLDTEGVISTGATFGRQQFIPEKDATVVARLRAAGAIVLGKTNTPEFTLGGLGGISTTSNLLYGAAHNPYNLAHSTRGSSGGAGSIVAAGGAAFDIGSDWGGSIRGPAHANGIVGIKPTCVRVPRTGHIVDYGGVFDLWQQLGPMARRVEDIALVTPIISGPDYRDAACAPVPWRDPAKVDLSKLKVAYFAENGTSTTSPATIKTARKAAEWLSEIAVDVVEDCPKDIMTDLYAARSALVSGDGWQFYKRLADKWGTKNMSPSVKARVDNANPISSAAYVKAWQKHDLAKSRMLRWMMSNNYDVIICPTAASAAVPIDDDDNFPFQEKGWSYRGIFNTTGWPGVVVRCGTADDGVLPIGLQAVAGPWREDICIAVASYLEMRSGGWKRPAI
jgi:amidase